MKTIVVNLIGAAGSGKSTLASEIFAKLKREGYNCEYVPEFVKKSVYENNMTILHNQLVILANQYYNMDILRDKVNIIITDSPILLSIFYNQNNHSKQNTFKIPDEILNKLILYIHGTFDNLNFFIVRNHEYKREGRYQDEEQAKEEEKRLMDMMDSLNINMQHLLSTDDCAKIIIDKVKERMKFYNSLKKSGQEIERKFLVKNLPFNINSLEHHDILQGYLMSNNGEMRIRSVDNKNFYLTRKFGQGWKREEFEKEITMNEFFELLGSIDGNLIKKRRYYYPFEDGKVAEIDCYYGKLKRLKTVEVEFPSFEEADTFQKPDWFGKEVTDSMEFKNRHLSQLNKI